jgi:cytochrome d ubiquinol oxidase subunit II
VWDGNEVWLLAAGGTLFFAFPLLYASAFSGFYMPLMIVLWLLILRGLAVELRNHVADRVWRALWDGVFFLASTLLAVFFGAALANVIRGVPLGADHSFYLPLWTDWRTGAEPGILDWYTVLGGLFALVALAVHGALYLGYKTEGALLGRAHRAATRLIGPLIAGALVCIPATVVARPNSLATYAAHPAAFLAPAGVAVCLLFMLLSIRRGRETAAFVASCGFLAFMLIGAAAGMYPVLLPSTLGSGADITVANAIAGPHTLYVGLIWWSLGTCLAVFYFVVVYWLFRGKVSQYAETYGH